MKFNRRTFLKGVAGLAATTGLTGAAGVTGYEYATRVETTWLSTEHLPVPIKNLPASLEGFKIVQLSDIHLHPFTQIDFVKEVVAAANQLQPDLVALTGDFVLKTAGSIFELAPALATLNPKYGIFAVLGNHDIWTDARTVRAGLEEAGLPLLRNEGLALGVGKDLLYVAGVDDGWSGRPDLALALDRHRGDIPTLLLAHEPDLADRFAADPRVSLQLSGHTHGGQVRLPGKGPLVLPRLGHKYEMGLYRVADMWVYTNRGIGVIDPPVRFNCRPEITEITLVGA
ncbi:MAG: metallophosphoesterase [Anaerolineales bacterium]|nr:metallophosphoesterase [Anaerolineales bacterium]